jgi:RNA polymerase sigma-70 factor (ECF subfamily)
VGALVARLLGRSADAEDVLQDSFISAFSRLSQLRDPSRFRAWLLRIAVHHAHRRFRKRKLLAVLGLDRGHDDASLQALGESAPDGETRAELAQLDRLLATLPADARIAWMLRHVEGYELTEVAAACGVSLATCKRKLARAHALIAEHVQIEAPTDSPAESPTESESADE